MSFNNTHSSLLTANYSLFTAHRSLLTVFCLLLTILCLPLTTYSQVELVPVGHPVYDFLKRADLNGWIEGYNSAILPISREATAKFIKFIKLNVESSKLSSVDKKLLSDYEVEFGYDIDGSLKKSGGVLQGVNIFDNDKQKYLYQFADSNVSFFVDLSGWVSYRQSDGDSVGHHSIGLGEPSLRFRGTFFNSVGFYLRMSNGQRLYGKPDDVPFARVTNPKWRANHKMTDNSGNFDSYEGYIRYATPGEWLALTVGKEQVTAGFGYVDKLFLSDNPVPFSFARLDLEYKKLHYFFIYGSLRGDSLGREQESKYIVTHRVNLNLLENLKFGFFESLIVSDRPFNFTYLNPFSFLRSADYSAGDGQSSINNAILGFDMEVKPFRKVALQASWLIDDFNFETLFDNKRETGKLGNDNRFGWQLGAVWTDGFFIPNLTAALEWTRLNPYIYSHRTNKSNYVHWTLPIGHSLQPNSHEVAIKLNYDITHRLNFKMLYRYQWHAEGLIFSGDTLKINYGGSIYRGDGDIKIDNKFLNGNRIDISKLTLSAVWQPIRQYFIEGTLAFWSYDLKYIGVRKNDVWGWVAVRVGI